MLSQAITLLMDDDEDEDMATPTRDHGLQQDAPQQDRPRQDAPQQHRPRQDAPQQHRPRQDAPLVFDQMDANNDGLIDREELASWQQQHPGELLLG